MYAMLFGKLPYRAKHLTGPAKIKHLLDQKKEGLSSPKHRKYLLKIPSGNLWMIPIFLSFN